MALPTGVRRDMETPPRQQITIESGLICEQLAPVEMPTSEAFISLAFPFQENRAV